MGSDRDARYWWLRMVAASAALAAVLLTAYFLPPAVTLHYHAWRWRSRQDRDSLESAANTVVARRLPRNAVVRLLGKPTYEGGNCLSYRDRSGHPDIIWLRDGRAASVEHYTGGGGYCFCDAHVDWRKAPGASEAEAGESEEDIWPGGREAFAGRPPAE